MPRTRLVLALAAGLLAGAGFAAAPQQPVRRLPDAELDQLRAGISPADLERDLLAARPALSLNQDHGFRHLSSQVEAGGDIFHHVRQTFRGVPVYGGELVVRRRSRGADEVVVDRLHRDLALDVVPSLAEPEIRSIARSAFRPADPEYVPRQLELSIYPILRSELKPDAPARPYGPNAEDFTTRVVEYRLVYIVRNLELYRPDGPKQMVHVIDAHTGQVIDEWNDLHTQAAKGTGKSQYNGTVTLDTNRNGTVYELRDLTRGTLAHPWTGLVGNQTNNLNNKGKVNATTGQYSEDPGLGALYTDADNAWGDGTNYVEGSDTNAPQGQTGGVDTHFGVAMTWDMYKNVFGRNGIDGKGTSALNRVHFAHGDTVSEANAFWIGYAANDPQACFCMTYGDGANDFLYGINFKEMTALDVAGHELSHGVCETTANLAYSKDAGGLNEANSDIFGTMVEFYVRGAGGTGATIPDTGGNWLIGNELDANNKPLRWMTKPSKDGKSFDYWESGFNTGSGTTYDPHFTSGPMNRCFYFMSQGASAATADDTYSKYLTAGMTGIGNQRSAQIWYRALLKLTTNATYVDARNAAIQSAKELYGAGGAEEQAVWNAFGGINVGAIWTGGGGNSAPVITGQPQNASVQAGQTATFTVVASGTGLSYQWRKGGASITGATAASYTTPATTLSDSGSLFSVVVSNAYGSATSGNATLTVTSTPPASNLLVNGGFETGTAPWAGTTADIGAWTKQPAHGGSRCAWLCGNGYFATESLAQSVALPASASRITLSFWLHIDTAETGAFPYDTLAVQVRNSAGTILKTLGSFSNLNAAPGYVQKSYDLTAYRGQAVQIYFKGSEDFTKQTSFVLDDVVVAAN